MKKYILAFFFSVPFFIHAQNLPQCDSLVIDCCTLGNDTISLNASNTTTELFGYPGFILFDSNMDTIAKENVTYFGIGGGPQLHEMVVMAPLMLPFTGYLNLYYMFYDSLGCSFPITIADTSTGVQNLFYHTDVRVYPNPAADRVTVRSNHLAGNTIQVIDLSGRILHQTRAMKNSEVLNIQSLSTGIYFIELVSGGAVISRTKLIKQ